MGNAVHVGMDMSWFVTWADVTAWATTISGALYHFLANPEAVASLLAASIVALIAVTAAQRELRQRRTEGAITAFSQLRYEMAYATEELDDIGKLFWRKGWPNNTESPDYYHPPTLRGALFPARANARTMLQRQSDSQEPVLSRSDPNALHYKDEPNMRYPDLNDIEAFGLKSNSEAYKEVIILLRDVLSKSSWQKAVLAIGDFYEQREYASTLYIKARLLLKPEGLPPRAVSDLDPYCTEYYKFLMTFYWLNVCEANEKFKKTAKMIDQAFSEEKLAIHKPKKKTRH